MLKLFLGIILIIAVIVIIYWLYTTLAQSSKVKDIWNTLLTFDGNLESDLMPGYEFRGKYKCWYLFRITDDKNGNARVFTAPALWVRNGDYCYTTYKHPKADFRLISGSNHQSALASMIEWADKIHPEIC